jgi:diguanylate cyclase (GGDEF)-like protein
MIPAEDGVQALQILLKQKIDLVILDWIMPKMDGIKLLQTIRSHPDLQDIPTILMTVKGKMTDKILGLKEGATEFISKPFYPEELTIRVENLLRIKQYQETLEKQNRKLEKLSTHDPLTGLYNRNYLKIVLKREWARCQRFKSTIGCLMIDLDSFKSINDKYGHQCGDNVIKELSRIISSLLRGYDFACRYGGDEIIVILPEASVEGIRTVGNRILHKISEHHFLKGKKLKITTSIGGTSVNPNDSGGMEEMISLADQALYQAKRSGKNKLSILND